MSAQKRKSSKSRNLQKDLDELYWIAGNLELEAFTYKSRYERLRQAVAEDNLVWCQVMDAMKKLVPDTQMTAPDVLSEDEDLKARHYQRIHDPRIRRRFEMSEKLRNVLEEIITDATGNPSNPQKRIHPIRPDLYRKARTLLDEY